MNASNSTVMKILGLYVLVVLCLISNAPAAEERLQKDTTAIEKDSEIKLIMDVMVQLYDLDGNKRILSMSGALKCQNGTVTKVFDTKYSGGTKKEKKRIYPIKKYLKMWKEMEALGIWEMKSPEQDQYHSRTEWEMESILKYYIRCGYKEHMIVIKRAKGLKDPKYRKMQKIFNEVFIKSKF